MKWINHSLIAGSIAACISPVLVPAAVLGATAPDWMEDVAGFFGQKVKHRTTTHYVFLWATLSLFFLLVVDYHHFGLAFSLGGLSHVLTDALTVTGVPVAPWSDKRIHLFGGRLRTGDPAEYIISGAFVVAAGLLNTSFAGDWMPYFMNWQTLYEEGLLDASEWRMNRFQFL